MAETISAIVQFKRMTRAQWSTSQYVPKEGELVCESDTGFVKVGDGTHRYPDLRYLTGPQGERGLPGEQGVQGPPGRDGVVTFENLSQAQRASLKGDRGEPGPAGHSLNASIRIEGSYKNNATSILNLFVDVYFDGEKVTSGYMLDYYFRGFGNNNWQVIRNQSVDSAGKFGTWGNSQRSGGWFEVRVEVTYKNHRTSAFYHLDNLNDGARGSDGVVNYASAEAQQALSVYAKKSETPVYRIAKGDIPGSGAGATATINTTDLMNPDGVKVGDIIQDFYSSVYGADEGWWKVTNVNNTSISVTGIGTRRLYTPYNDADIKRRLTTLEDRPAATGFVNQKTGQAMNYWMGSKAEFDAIRSKDANTVYDYYE